VWGGSRLSQFDELPEGWEIINLKDLTIDFKSEIVDGPFGSNLKASEYQDSGIPIIRLQNIDRGLFIDKNIKFISSEKADSLKRHSFVSGDIVITKLGDPLGKACLVPTFLEKGIIVADIVRLRVKEENSLKSFLMNLVNSPLIVRQLQIHVKGSTRPRVNLNHIRDIRIPLPPLNEQRRIVEKIEALTARSRKARAALDDIPALLDQFRQSVLAAAFRGDLTADWRAQNPDVGPAEALLKQISEEENLPHGWCTTPLESIIDSLKYGTSKKGSYEQHGIPVLRIPNVSEGMIKHDDLKYTELTEKEIQDLSLVPGDILMIRSNGSVSLVGKTALVGDNEQGFAYAGYLIRVRLNHSLTLPKYLDLCLSSYDLRAQIEIPARSTSGVHNINAKEIQRLKIPLAPLEEQKEIIRKIMECFDSTAQLENVFEETLAEQGKLDQSILAKAFRGELVPQDPNDEPAAVLLDHIRSEREKQQGLKKNKSTQADRKRLTK
jgi:type I restriction enzyme S subunit